MKPSFSSLWMNYPKSNSVRRKDLFGKIGWDNLVNDPNYENTCAIRVSIALQKSGVPVNSSAGMRALAGSLKGKFIEIRQEKLSEQLFKLWGTPESISKESDVGDRNGVISFFEIPGYTVGGGLGGHIDLIDGKSTWLFGLLNEESVCGSNCYWSASRIEFWELKS